MVLIGSKKLKGVSFEDLTAVIGEDTEFRNAVIQHLAKNHSREFLQHVNINAGLLSDISARVISSAKEWQE